MKLHGLSPILWTKDLQQTRAFYENVLGFTGVSNFPNFVSFKLDSVEIMFIVPQDEPDACKEPGAPPFFPKPQLTGSIFIYMAQVDKLWQNVKDKVTVITPIDNRAYRMRDFSIRDNNGYELVFGEDISRTE
ncbi:MAG: hypothetical protein HC859_02480 [Bacteroidia bacterium]|nr:hypothetical protein [Bacteroidia bacterium]